MNNCQVLQVSHTDRVLPALQLHLCFSVSFSCRSLSPLLPSPHGLLPISPTDPITNCFLTGRELPCSAEEAGASLLLWCDQTLRYTPTDQGGELVCVCIYLRVCTVCVSVIWTELIESDIHIQSSSAGKGGSLSLHWPTGCELDSYGFRKQQWSNSKAPLKLSASF